MESSKDIKFEKEKEKLIQLLAEAIFETITGSDGKPSEAGMQKMLAAMRAAEKDYDTHDLNLVGKIVREDDELKIDDEFFDGVKGIGTIAQSFGLSMFVRRTVSSSRLQEFKSGDVNQNNYLDKLFQFLRGDGGLEVKSLKGYVLKHLFLASDEDKKTKDDVAYLYHNHYIDLITLKNAVCSQIHPETPKNLEEKCVEFILSKLPSLNRKKCAEIISVVIEQSRKEYSNASAFNFAKDIYRTWSYDFKEIVEKNCFKELKKILNEGIGAITPTSLRGLVIKNLFLKCAEIEESFLEKAEGEKLSSKEKNLLTEGFSAGSVDLEEIRVRLCAEISKFKKLKSKTSEIEMKAEGSDSSHKLSSRK